MRILTWNLFHGRAVPERRRALDAEFAAALAGWAWDVALLQEVPPWWPPALARACGADERTALTSRNGGLVVRRAIADRRPDLIRSNGGGANAILVRGEPIAGDRRALLRRWPERRVVHAVRLAGGAWVGNLHAQVHSETRARADIERAGALVVAWAGGAPAVLGGDFNVRTPTAPGFARAGGDGVDHVLVHGVPAEATTEVLDAGSLSDHLPLVVEVAVGKV
jgi:endonuclease/exonuclease/phosphatase family metal-dependent hydrolase